MGFSLEWLAIKDVTADQACAALGANRTGTFADIYSAPLMGAALPDGHYLVLADYLAETVALHDSFVGNPGIENEVLSYMCDDVTMMTMLQSWTNARRNWSVSRIEPTDDFEVVGPVPEPFQAIHDKLQAEQKREDPQRLQVDLIYDLTADLGKALTGFKHEEELDPAIRFEVLQLRTDSRFRIPGRSGAPRSGPTQGGPTARKPWWKFW